MYITLCMQIIKNQCEKRKAKLQHSITFDIADGEELYISSSDTNVNDHEWIIEKIGKLKVYNMTVQLQSQISSFLNQGCASLWPVHAWLLKIAFWLQSQCVRAINHQQPDVVKQVL